MSKKDSSKVTLQAEECTVVEPQKSSSTPKKPKSSNEIDEIFSGKKRKNPEKQKNDEAKETETDKPKSLKKKKKKSKEGKEERPRDQKPKEGKKERLTDPPSKHRKRTEDGLNIYTEEELGISSSNAGGTPLCPFDCECCF